MFTAASKVVPVVIYLEDVHWADDRSLDLINNLVRENVKLPLFILCMARPALYERRPQWGEGQRFHERIQLEPLSQLSSRRLVRELLKKVEEVPTSLRDLVVERADGNPFYIEELIKAMIDDRVIVKELVEVSHPEEEQGSGSLLLGSPELLHHRRVVALGAGRARRTASNDAIGAG